jgi:NAD(P)-dependent dehydrogenase (short-subunit alcohol dehydrogenase family)
MSGFLPPPRTALVTGAALRIGRELAIDLARRGWSVAVHYHRSGEAADEVVAAVIDLGGKAKALQADLGREDEVAALLPKAVQALGPIGCLINNASVFELDSVATATRSSWDLHMEVNLRAPFVLTQAFVAQLPEGMAGNVVNIIDQRVWNLTPYFTSYTLSKAGLWTLTQTLALALSPRVRVNAVGPGPTLPSPRQSQEQFQRQCQAMPLKRGTTPEEICQAVNYILHAPAMTGQMIALDGGQHLGWAQPAAPPAFEE